MNMTLYNNDLSPYTSRNRIQIRAKGIDDQIGLAETPAPELYKQIAPTGRIPCLDTGQGFHLVESETIAEFIEDAFPANSLRGSSALGRAKVRLFARLLDIYYLAGLNIMFGQISANPRDAAKVEDGLAKMDEGLALVEHYLADGELYACEGRLTLADCALVPALFYATIVPMSAGKRPFLGHDKAKAYFDRIVAEDPHCKRVNEEMDAALKQWMAARAA